MVRSTTLLGAVALGASTVLAQTGPKCSLTQKCPESAPCCGQYGDCGVGAFCLGGCDPRMSFSLDSCVPAPVCRSGKYTMNSMDRVKDIGEYLGDPDSADFVVQGEPLIADGMMLLTMPANSVGTVVSSTAYMWYGSVKARIRTSRGAGVVTAFILFSDVKDEIDYEWVGTELTSAQNNYYFQGIPSYVNSGANNLSDTFMNFHDYEIKWEPDQITWLIDGQVGRVKKRSETYNETTRQYDFPQTPSRVQLSLWPGGAPTNGQGTIDWAGGPIKWDHEDVRNFGYYFATVASVEISCFNANSPPGTNKRVSYTYGDARGTNDTVIDGDKPTVLKSLMGTGRDMNAGGSSTDNGTLPNNVPGGSSVGPGTNGQAQGGPGGGGSGTGSAPDCSTTGFSQSCGPSNEGGRTVGGERIVGASMFAVVVALAGMLMI